MTDQTPPLPAPVWRRSGGGLDAELATAGWDGSLTPPDAKTLPWLALIGACGGGRI